MARYSSAIAKEMGLPPEDVRKTRLSALLHDVGKIGIDDRIIRKPTALTDDEFELMKAHPSKGAAIMEAIPQMADIIPGMKWHHEKWEGGGYPDGLKGEEIPLQARIVAVADAFDAMTTTRPYQKAMEVSYVLERLRDMSQKRFDGAVVEALARSHAKGGLIPTEAAPARGRARPGGSMRARPRRRVLLAAALAAARLPAQEAQDLGRRCSSRERMAQVLLRENRPAEAEKAFREVLKEDPKNPEVQDGLGLSLLMQSRFEESLPYFDKAVDLAPHNASYRNNRGVALMELGQFKEAAADFEAAEHSRERRRPRLGDDQPGAPACSARELAGAEKAFTNALARDPQSFAATFGRAAARESTGRPRGSRRGLPGRDQAQPFERGGEPAAGPVPRDAQADRARPPVSPARRSTSTRWATPAPRRACFSRAPRRSS